MIIWPANLDSTKTRKTGRKIPKPQSVQSPRLDELSEAATSLSINHENVPAKARPRVWWEKGGYLIVSKSARKPDMLRALASEVRKRRVSKEKS
jgi:signal recognition particle subunit SRP19